MTSRAGGGVELRKLVYQHPEIYVQRFDRVAGIDFWYVDGDAVRLVYIDFEAGGNSEAYIWLPQNPPQVIIEVDLNPWNAKCTKLHELTELNTMRTGIGYETAHSDYANPVEDRARKNPRMFDQLWLEQVRVAQRWQLKHGLQQRTGQ